LEDWRQLVLADCFLAKGDLERAIQWFESVERLGAGSPLATTAARRQLDAWAARRQVRPFREVLERFRNLEPDRQELAQAESFALELARERGERELELEAARRLLVLAPLEASKLRVVDRLPLLGVSDWLTWLTPGEREDRAEALLAASLPDSALATLRATAEDERTFRWRILEAKALQALGQPLEALRRLAGVSAANDGERFELEWQRALLLEEAASVQSGKTPLPSAERERLRQAARQHLLAAARLNPSSPRGREALRRLAADALQEERVDEALSLLREIKRFHPSDTFGARVLWERGWREFQGRNPTGAIGYWTELASIYPETSGARAARYWMARAQEQLGRRERALELYRELARTRYSDFYARQAHLRLQGQIPAEPELSPPPDREAWPEDPVLARARWLTDAGLDGLAATELQLLQGQVREERAAKALGALVAQRRGDWRKSLRLLRAAFPALGSANQDRHPELALQLFYPLAFQDAVVEAARREGLPSALVFGIVHQESGFDPRARSRSGALGLMQVMPTTGRQVARNLGLPFSESRLLDPHYCLRLGTHYFRKMLGLFWGKEELALAGYNGGPGRISRLWRQAGPSPELDQFLEGLTIEETRDYVKRILVLADSYRRRYPGLL
jgi:soluble lytic murein transglycosylase-like protein